MKFNRLTHMFFAAMFFCCISSSKAQVTIGSGTPPQSYSVLELISSTGKPGGIRLPHLSNIDKATISADLLATPTKSKGLLIFNTTSDELEYWDGEKWMVAKQVEPWMVSGDNKLATLNTQNIYQTGQVTIGSGATADATAALNIVANDKGVLLPRVTLTNKADIITIPNPTEGLLVFNTGLNGAFSFVGFMFWNGAEWRRLVDGNTEPPKITALHCSTAILTPSMLLADQTYESSLEINYDGGNGAAYSGGVMATNIYGLEVTLQPGVLAVGSGKIFLTVAGTAAANIPAEITIPINFLTFNCSAVVGKSNARTETRSYLGAMTAVRNGVGTITGAEFVVTTLDGHYDLRFYCSKDWDLTATDIQMRHNAKGAQTSSQYETLIIMHQYTYSQTFNNNPPNNQYPDEVPNFSFGASAAAISHNDWKVPGTDINVTYTGGGSGAAIENQHRSIINGWKTHGDIAVYSNSRPEYRILIFTSSDPAKKRMYRYSFFFGAPASSFSAYAQTKCWIFGEEIISN